MSFGRLRTEPATPPVSCLAAAGFPADHDHPYRLVAPDHRAGGMAGPLPLQRGPGWCWPPSSRCWSCLPGTRLPCGGCFHSRIVPSPWQSLCAFAPSHLDRRQSGAGQGIFAWKLARMCRFAVAELLGRCLVVALFDLTLLLGLGFLASILNHDPRIAFFRWVCGAGLAAMGTLALGLLMLPARWRQKLRLTAGLTGWPGGGGGIPSGLACSAGAVWVCPCVRGRWAGPVRLAPSGRNGAGSNSTGLDCRGVAGRWWRRAKEATLVWLMPVSSDEQGAVLLSFGLIWSFVVILVRILIGLGGTWFARHDRSSMEQCSVPEGATARPALMNRSLP